MVAIAIFAVIGLGCWQVLNRVMASNEQLEQRTEQLRELQRGIWLLSRDINNIVDRPIRDNSGYKEPALTSLTANFLLQLTRSGWLNPSAQKRSELQRVAYNLEPDDSGSYTLIRTYWPVLDRAPDTNAIHQPLLKNVTHFELEFIAPHGEQLFYWPPNNRDKNQSVDSIPAGILIRIGTTTFGEIERLYTLRDRVEETP